ncbi:hypothetical protein ID866_12286 [Astraeus odoratus]|nr:hypothetical protein ID866_12286 [Astraeus odoratus]
MSTSAALDLGTLRWKAPELFEGEGPTIWTDVWAFGMTTLELFTRNDPYQEIPTMAAVMFAIVKGPPARPKNDTYLLTDEW